MSLPEIWSVGITCQLVDLLPSLAAIGLLLAFIWSIAKITRIMLASTPIPSRSRMHSTRTPVAYTEAKLETTPKRRQACFVHGYNSYVNRPGYGEVLLQPGLESPRHQSSLTYIIAQVKFL